MRPRSTTEQFIEKAKTVHGNKYSYDKVEYIGARDKVIITCPVHGEFSQLPNIHLTNHGCTPCGDDRRQSDTNRFIQKAKKVHEDKFDYDKVNYTYSNVKVTITCSIHGDFQQKPNNHLDGQGCPSCKESRGEKRIHEILVKYEIPCVREFKFPNTGLYEYDFYLPQHKLLIEFHGKQHFEAINFFGGQERLEYTQRCDKHKLKVAQAFKVRLIEFTYIDFKLPEEEFEQLVIDAIRKTLY